MTAVLQRRSLVHVPAPPGIHSTSTWDTSWQALCSYPGAFQQPLTEYRDGPCGGEDRHRREPDRFTDLNIPQTGCALECCPPSEVLVDIVHK